MTEINRLNQVNGPADVKKLTITEMQQAAAEIRELVLNKVSKVSGHVGPNLGVTELTLAFHYVFDSPKDKIVWDVSHQSYPHKILTGRKEGFLSEELYNDVTGYSSQFESPHDYFTVGHTSTSISLAVGLAKARDLKSETGNVVALIGDGSLSGGLAFEGLNNGAELQSNFIVIVNDNEMSIDENFGGLYRSLAELRATNGKSENNLFKAMGFDYRYVEEGNDLPTLIETFKQIKDIDHPLVLHVHTEKGHGYEKAIANKMMYHWRTPFDLETGEAKTPAPAENYNTILMEYLDQKVTEEKLPLVAINAAIPGAFGLKQFQAQHPDRYFDVGIAEGHSITFASALASQGIRPVVFQSSTFLQRAYDQLSHDLAINSNPAVIIVKAGSITKNSVTHQGLFDIPLISSIPNIKYLAPATKEELTAMLDWALAQTDYPVAIRIPEHGVQHSEQSAFELGKYKTIHSGSKVAILALGGFLPLGKQVVEQLADKHQISATLINPQSITEFDAATMDSLKANHQLTLTLEDGSLAGGFGEKISHYYGATAMRVLNFGAKKEFTDNEALDSLYNRYHLTADLIVQDAIQALSAE
jgi:1-deoxy-D-xylulose-5-phosphate synthase